MMVMMIRRRRAALLAVFLTVLAAVAGVALVRPASSMHAAATTVAEDPAAGLVLTSSVAVDARMTDLTFTTPAVTTPVTVRVMLPTAAAVHPDARYPVLYLLHGSGFDHAMWTTMTGIEEMTANMGLIVVMPDAGSDGWYTNWPDGRQPQWERFHLNQLVPWIDAHEPTLVARSQRAIAGSSMGGFGAMAYAARRPDLFAAAASFSGAVDISFPKGPAGQSGFYGVEPWGPWTGPEASWRAHNPYDLAANLRGLELAIYTGNGQPGGPLDGDRPYDETEAVLEQQSSSLAARLGALGIPRLFDDYGPGGHLLDYSARDLQQWLPRLFERFAHPVAPPSPFSFTAAEQTFSMRGYTVFAMRDRLALRTIARVRTAGFTLTTDGPATVTTARRYARRARYRIAIRSAGRQTQTTVLRSSADGRLTILVPRSASVGITRAAAAS
jgi:S-formylglutathione hydrolase FrmB